MLRPIGTLALYRAVRRVDEAAKPVALLAMALGGEADSVAHLYDALADLLAEIDAFSDDTGGRPRHQDELLERAGAVRESGVCSRLAARHAVG